MGVIYELLRAPSDRVETAFNAEAEHPFPIAEVVVDEEELQVLVQGVLSALSDDALNAAAVWLLQTEESDLAPAARSSGATHTQRVAEWKTLLIDLRPFAREAMAHAESLYLYVAL